MVEYERFYKIAMHKEVIGMSMLIAGFTFYISENLQPDIVGKFPISLLFFYLGVIHMMNGVYYFGYSNQRAESIANYILRKKKE